MGKRETVDHVEEIDGATASLLAQSFLRAIAGNPRKASHATYAFAMIDDERDEYKHDATILVHAYDSDNRPPEIVCARYRSKP